ncbi:MAG TPA: hypothetical protein HA306_04030 [Methanosarcina sp.]|nr:hypothetical protein [Methanosarcina sp.]
MNNLFKALIAILVIILLLGAALIIGGMAFLFPVERSSEAEETVVWEESSQNEFTSESYSYDDRFKFVYTPVNPNALLDCYVSYHFQEDGTTQENIDRRLYENVSTENPISFEFPKRKGSRYKLDITIEDKDGAVLHKSEVEIYSSLKQIK